MAKKSMINRDIKRLKIAEKFKSKRLELKKIIKSGISIMLLSRPRKY